MTEEKLKYSLAIEKAAATLHGWYRSTADRVDRDDLPALVREASGDIQNHDELPNTLLTIEHVFECMEAIRVGIDWRADYCRPERTEELDPVQVARCSHEAALDYKGDFGGLQQSLAAWHQNMYDTLRWSGYGTITQKLADAEWNKLELARLTKLVNG